MSKRKGAPTVSENEASIERLARDCVNQMIQDGYDTAAMKMRRMEISNLFNDFMLRDIRTFAETGKYPEYV